jgi:hypothetical protein
MAELSTAFASLEFHTCIACFQSFTGLETSQYVRCIFTGDDVLRNHECLHNA